MDPSDEILSRESLNDWYKFSFGSVTLLEQLCICEVYPGVCIQQKDINAIVALLKDRYDVHKLGVIWDVANSLKMNPLELKRLQDIEGLLGVAFVVHSGIQRTAFELQKNHVGYNCEILYRLEDAFRWVSELFVNSH